MASPKQLWVIAGGNGAGKTTFCNLYLAKYGVKFVNADSIAMTIDPEHPENASYHAATLAAKIREDLISQSTSLPGQRRTATASSWSISIFWMQT